jgi:YD repeat-containing protein
VRRLLFLLAALALPAAAQQQLPGLDRGLEPGKLYQFNGFDNISVYGGNLSIRIPLGMAHAGDGGLSYQFAVNYNGRFWDYRSGPSFVHAYPAASSNAGLGWSFGFGRYIPKNDVTNSFLNTEVYEAANGAQYPFQDTESGTSISYAKKASLRLRPLSTTIVEIDFPDGTVQRHIKTGSEWRIQEIRAPRGGDKVTIEYLTTRPSQCPMTITTSWWRVSDGPSNNRREHYVCFRSYEMDDDPKPAVERVVLHPSPAGQSVYLFQYEEVDNLSAPGEYDSSGNPWRTSHSVALLKSITFPDASKYQFEHEGSNLKTVTLPTLAQIEYTYGDLTAPNADRCFTNWRADLGLGSLMHGVTTRTLRTPAAAGRPAEAQEWIYRRSWKALNPSAPNYLPSAQAYLSTFTCPEPLIPEATYRVQLYDMMTVSVEEPPVVVDGVSTYSRVDSHFSVWPGDQDAPTSPAGFRDSDYSFPHGPRDPAQNRFLSQEHYECTGGTCTKTSTTYARYYSTDMPTSLESQRIVFNDDCSGGTCRWVTTDSSDRDGYEHFRTETTTHNFDGVERSRTVTTDWNRINGQNRTIGVGERWFPNTYEKVTVTEGAQTRVEQACFDLQNGFMTARRMLKGTAPDANDLVTTATVDPATGNVTAESFYGGDAEPLPAGAQATPLCSAASTLAGVTPPYRINHTWQNGVLAASQYSGVGHKSLDLTIHRTGLVTSARDSAGVETSYQYDTSGRIKTIQPPAGTAQTPGGATTTYEYTNALLTNGSLTPASATQTTGTGTYPVSVTWQFDSMGRIWREKRRLPDGGCSVQETLYDAMGRKRSVSEPERLPAQGSELSFIPSAVTTFRYDVSGRTLTTTAPDQSRTRLAYLGSREISRFTKALNEPEKARGKETYDGFGRLVRVTERPDIAGDVITSYTYDAGGKLSEVHMLSPLGIVQRRNFDYDGRGFLRWEQHPESGMSAYTYDAKGLVRTKDQSAAGSQFDLKYTYDAVGRLQELQGRNPLYGTAGQPEYRAIRSLTYATANSTYTGADGVVRTNYAKGKLDVATRYNYPPQGFDTTYTVADRYIYADALGRHTVRETTIDTVPGVFAPKKITTAVRYNDLGLPESFRYPMCVDCGAPATPDRSGMTYGYAAGRLTSIAGFVTSMTYWPNGMRNVLAHQNGIADTQTVGNMPRPSQIAFGPYSRCVRPTITAHPVSKTVAAGASFTLSVAVAGSGPFTYRWFNRNTGQIVSYDAQLSTQVSATTEFNVEVASACGSVESEVARVSVNLCPTPETGLIRAIRQPDGSWILTPDPIARPGAEFFWRKAPANMVVAQTKTLTVSNLTATTTYGLSIADECGTSPWTEITIRIPLSITKFGLVAALTPNPNEVKVEWPVVAGATSYVVERRSGANWAYLDTRTVPSWTGLQPANTTYAYRVYAIGESSESEYSNADVVTTGAFTQAVSGSVIASGPSEGMRAAVNSVRAAAGWKALSWQEMLSATDPLPVPGSNVLARHIMACRARMHEALQALGVPITPYALQELAQAKITAEHINEVQRRAQ